MLLPRWFQFTALLCLCLCFQLASAAVLEPVRRADPPPPTTSPSPTLTDGGDGGKTATPTPTAKESGPVVDASSILTNASSTTVSSATATATNGSLNNTMFNATIPAGELPLSPRVTPGWAVAGVILIGTGAVYALIGIKKQRLHTFFSTAYLVSLATTVLILYVMTPPISDAIQGAYVVAIVVTGVVLGGAAIIFPEITECLACLLGGFCLGMWLLCLQEGGLLTATAPKAVFISAFTLAAFACYFSRYTRTYALIACISFAGATATVIGIDCFSRAGLKEFWAYIWDLNGNIFPLGANTYPLTRGMRVELAATVILCLAGLISQFKVWQIIKERRAKRDSERAEGERDLQQEDEDAGRQIEDTNARERRQWEAVYGNGDGRETTSPDLSADSAVGDLESEKRRNRHSQITTNSRSQSQPEPIEMSELAMNEAGPPVPPKARAAAEMVMVQDGNAGMVTVRVASDDLPEVPLDERDAVQHNVWVVGADGEARLATMESNGFPRGNSSLNSPNVVPLPFRVPDAQEQPDDHDDDRSSIATYADEDDRSIAASKRGSFAKRLSRGSADLLRSLSQRSRRSAVDKTECPGESREELVISRRTDRGDNESIAATDGGMSSNDGDANTIRDGESPLSTEINAQLGYSAPDKASVGEEETILPIPRKSSKRPLSTVETVGTDILNSSETGDNTTEQPSGTNTSDTPLTTEGDMTSGSGSATISNEGTRKAKSVASTSSAAASITRERLPRAMSRIALSYRTNEWAKHLSNAETPQPASLQLGEFSEVDLGNAKNEEVAPVNVADLQQTAENANPAPRSVSALSSYPSIQTLQPPSRSASRQSIGSSQTPEPQARNNLTNSANGSTNPYQNHPNMYRRLSSKLFVQTIAEENDIEHLPDGASLTREDSPSSGPAFMSPSAMPHDRSASSLSVNRPPVAGVVSYASPQTLIGRREMFLRNKSQGSLAVAPTPEPMALSTIPSRATSDAGSMYNYPMYAPALVSPNSGTPVDLDDLPMSQRREVMRQSSLMSLSAVPGGSRPNSVVGFSTSSTPTPTAEGVTFNSHQPRRASYVPTQTAREAQLANFRTSVAADLRAGTPVVASVNNGRETPVMGSLYGGSVPHLPAGRDTEVRQTIDHQRTFLMGQKDAESQRREFERAEKERNERAFEERMRRGDWLEAHRDAMRRMQAAARD